MDDTPLYIAETQACLAEIRERQQLLRDRTDLTPEERIAEINSVTEALFLIHREWREMLGALEENRRRKWSPLTVAPESTFIQAWSPPSNGTSDGHHADVSSQIAESKDGTQEIGKRSNPPHSEVEQTLRELRESLRQLRRGNCLDAGE